MLLAVVGQAFAAPRTPVETGPEMNGLKRCTQTLIDKPSIATLGKSTVVNLDYAVVRIASVARIGLGASQVNGRAPAVSRPGAPNAAAGVEPMLPLAAPEQSAAATGAVPRPGTDGVSQASIALLSPQQLFVLGRRAGALNVVLQDSQGVCHIKDIVVTIDPSALQEKIAELMPDETNIKVRGAENALVLTGKVSDAIKLDHIMNLATSYGDGKKVVNLLSIQTPQQVMLEVKIAEVSKSLIDKLGSSVSVNRTASGGTDSFSLGSGFLSRGGAVLQALRFGRTSITLDGQKDDGLVRVLAEPNIMAISGQQASFLSGGKIFIPVAQSSSTGTTGGPTITLEEKEFGIGVKFIPTVLDGSRVNLKMVSEVSDLSQTGSPFTTVNGVTSVLPSLTVRRADTTVQLNDGQSFVIAGLIKNNYSETIKRFPGLGEMPVLGTLFRSTEFQNDQTELLFVITPHLVKPLNEAPRLPTDNHVPPTRAEVYLNGSLESAQPAPQPQTYISR